MRKFIRIALMLVIAFSLQGCLYEGGWGIFGRIDARKTPMDQVRDAAKEGKGFYRIEESGGIGKAPEKTSATRTEDGWAPTPTPPVPQPQLLPTQGNP